MSLQLSVPNVIHHDSISKGSSESTTDSEDDEYDPSEVVADSDETLEYTSSDSSATDSSNESPSLMWNYLFNFGATKPQTSSTMRMASNPSLYPSNLWEIIWTRTSDHDTNVSMSTEQNHFTIFIPMPYKTESLFRICHLLTLPTAYHLSKD